MGRGKWQRAFVGTLVLAWLCVFVALPVKAQPHPRLLREWRENSSTAHPAFLSVTAEGHLLVVRNGYLEPSVSELDANGQKVWEYGPVQATAALRLPNGNTLICDSGSPGPPAVPRVIEVTPDGKVVWEYRTANRAAAPQFAQRLANGHTLITLPDRVIEVDQSGRLVWTSKSTFLRAVQGTRLADGHTLVVDRGLGQGGRVVELGPDGQAVWQYPAGPAQPVLVDPIGASREEALTRIIDLGEARILTVDRAGNVVDAVGWQDVLATLPVGNSWWAAASPSGSMFLAASYTNGRSTILEIDGRQVRLYLNEKLVLPKLAPFLEEGQVLVPLREFTSLLGGSLDWDQAAKQATVRGIKGILLYTVGEPAAIFNGQEEPLPAAPRFIGNTLFVPYARLAEILGAQASFDETVPALYISATAPNVEVGN